MRALAVFGRAPPRARHQACAPTGSQRARRPLGRWRRFPRAGKTVGAVSPRICSHGPVLSEGHRSSARAARPDHDVQESLSAESSQRDRDQPATLHLDAGSSSWSSTSCSTARERIRSRVSLSAASITCETRARTSCEISGFHIPSLVSSFAAMASTAENLILFTTSRSTRTVSTKQGSSEPHVDERNRHHHRRSRRSGAFSAEQRRFPGRRRCRGCRW